MCMFLDTYFSYGSSVVRDRPFLNKQMQKSGIGTPHSKIKIKN